MRDQFTKLAEKYLVLTEAEKRSEIIHDFIEFAIKELGIEGDVPEIVINTQPGFAPTYKTYGMASPRGIVVSIYNRALGDVLRTLGHELVHIKQFETQETVDGSTGSEDENKANSEAGVLLRKYGKAHPNVYTIVDDE